MRTGFEIVSVSSPECIYRFPRETSTTRNVFLIVCLAFEKTTDNTYRSVHVTRTNRPVRRKMKCGTRGREKSSLGARLKGNGANENDDPFTVNYYLIIYWFTHRPGTQPAKV